MVIDLQALILDFGNPGRVVAVEFAHLPFGVVVDRIGLGISSEKTAK
jgi:hypothetical protein